MYPPGSVQHHEAAHAVAFLHRGYAVDRIEASTFGGSVTPAVPFDSIDPDTIILTAFAGHAGQAIVGDYADGGTTEDMAIIDRYAGRLTAGEADRARAAADSFVWGRPFHGQIVELANILESRPVLSRSDLAAIVHDRGSKLHEYRDLYTAKPSTGSDRVYHPAGGCPYVSDCGPAPEVPSVPGLRWFGSCWTRDEASRPLARRVMAVRTLDMRV
jgi:hypothetical protein